MSKELLTMSAQALKAAYQTGALSPVEVCSSLLDHIEKHDEALNAGLIEHVHTVVRARARARARARQRNHHPGVRLEGHHRQSPVRADQQPLEPGTHCRRQQRRQLSGGLCRHGAPGAGHGCRRLNSHPGRFLRHRGP